MLLRSVSIGVIISCSFLCFAAKAPAQPTYFVNHAATGANTGMSWADAFTNLQSALTIAQYGDEIWVAQGVYKPIVPLDPQNVTDPERNTPFRIFDGVRLFGGFDGMEQNLNERDWKLNTTILSGDLVGNDNNNIQVTEPTRQDNSWHVVFMGEVDLGPVDENTTVDGFTITGGNADPPEPNPDDSGGGIWLIGARNGQNINDFSRPVLRNLIFRENTAHFGGGMGCNFSEPTLLNLEFYNNTALEDGGGVHFLICNSEIRNSIFQNNRAGDFGGAMMNNRGASNMAGIVFLDNSAFRGGAMYSLLDFTYVINSKFGNNVGSDAAGAMYIDDSPAAVMNSVFSGNSTDNPASIRGGGAIYILLNTPFLTNNVFYGNTTATEGGAIASISSESDIINSIFWGNQAAGTENEIFSGGQQQDKLPLLLSNIIQGGLPNNILHINTNLFQDPLFVNPLGLDGIIGTIDDDFRLTGTSPAIDAGVNSLVLFDFMDLNNNGIHGDEGVSIDLAGADRIYSMSGGEHFIDLGPFEYGAPFTVTEIETDRVELPVVSMIVDAFPNPFSAQATLRYALPEAGRVVIKMYDMLGREVATVVDAFQPSGIHEARFSSPDLSSGMYIYQISAGGRSETRKMMLVR